MSFIVRAVAISAPSIRETPMVEVADSCRLMDTGAERISTTQAVGCRHREY